MSALIEPHGALPLSRRLRLETLVNLRWLAVGGQTVAVVLVEGAFGFPVPLAACLTLIGLSAWFNLILRLFCSASLRLKPREAALLLGYDVLQLAGLLYLTGGLQNPFSFLFLTPVIVSAAALPQRHTIALGVLVLICATLLSAFHWPLPWRSGETLDIPLLYVAGVWIALASSLAFMAVYARRVAEETRQLAEALAATELALAHEQHLSALDGLAAAAAHELSTPLATIALAAKELRRNLPQNGPDAEDAALISEQIGRCRGILAKLRLLDSDPDLLAHMPLSHLIDEIAEPHRDGGVAIAVDLEGDDPEPIGRRNPGLLYGLGNLVENAVDFAKSEVTIRARWSAESVSVTICDDGPGVAPDVLDRLGEPYVTTRGRDGRRSGDEREGLGLGVFIAKTLLERAGARLVLANRPHPETGALVTILWPRAAMDTAAPLEDRRMKQEISQPPREGLAATAVNAYIMK